MKKRKKVFRQFVRALENGKPLYVIDTIIEQNLLVLEKRFGDLCLTPLNKACFYATSWSGEYRLDIIERLIERCPKALTLEDRSGGLPLHYICESRRGSLDLVQFCVNYFPDSVKAKTTWRKHTPLHCVVGVGISFVENELSLDVIQFLYQQYPGALLDQDNDGMTPLHLACCKPCPELEYEVLQTVYHPKAARMRARNDDTLFHLAYEGRNESAIPFLLQRDPVLLVELHAQNKIGSRMPMYFGCSQSLQIAALALVGELVYTHQKFPSKIEPNVMAEHLAILLETTPFPTLQQLHSPNAQNALRVCLKWQMYEELHSMLYNSTFRELLQGYRNMIRINRSDYLREDPGNKAKCVAVLASTAGGANNNNISNVHLLFQQLRANTLVCNRKSSTSSLLLEKNGEQQQLPGQSKRKRKANQMLANSKEQQEQQQEQQPRRSKPKRTANHISASSNKQQQQP